MANDIELLTHYAKAWNNLEVKYIEPFLAEDFIYESQWVLEALEGKQKYIAYLSGKFNTLRNTLLRTGKSVSAELGYFNTAFKSDKPCIILIQENDTEVIKAGLFIQSKNGLISRADLCGIPDPSDARLFNIFPR